MNKTNSNYASLDRSIDSFEMKIGLDSDDSIITETEIDCHVGRHRRVSKVSVLIKPRG